MKRRIATTFRLILSLVLVLALACSNDDNPVNGDNDQVEEGPPASGQWTGDAGYGTVSFEVDSGSTAITEIKYSFSDWTCGGCTRSGSVTSRSPSGWPITDREFTITDDMSQSIDLVITTVGSFNRSGVLASGTYEAVSCGATCSGEWSASHANVVGTLTFPTFDTTATYFVAVDNDMNRSNGHVAVMEGACWSDMSTGYGMIDVPPGTYYVYAGVPIVSSGGGFPVNGDCFGVYGGTFADPPSEPNAVVYSSQSAEFDVTLELIGTVSGTLTLPAPAPGRNYYVSIIGDLNGEWELVSSAIGECGSGESVNYTIKGVPSGTYYVTAGVGVVSSPDDPYFREGDYVGYYGGTLADPPEVPNAVVPTLGSAVFDITLEVYTELAPNPARGLKSKIISQERRAR